MINSRDDLRYYMACDRIALKIPEGIRHPRPVLDVIWDYEICLRRLEYHLNLKHVIRAAYYKIRLRRKGQRLGLTFEPNVFGPGLSIAHWGSIVVNPNARVGANCRIHEGVTLGATNGSPDAPQIGSNCFLGSGAKVIGGIRIGNDVSIGAGAVVVKDFPESGVTLGGIPAKVISRNGSESNIVRATEIYALNTKHEEADC